MAIARLGRVFVNTVTCCYSRGLATGLNAVILLRYVSSKKSECYKSFESGSRASVATELQFNIINGTAAGSVDAFGYMR